MLSADDDIVEKDEIFRFTVHGRDRRRQAQSGGSSFRSRLGVRSGTAESVVRNKHRRNHDDDQQHPRHCYRFVLIQLQSCLMITYRLYGKSYSQLFNSVRLLLLVPWLPTFRLNRRQISRPCDDSSCLPCLLIAECLRGILLQLRHLSSQLLWLGHLLTSGSSPMLARDILPAAKHYLFRCPLFSDWELPLVLPSSFRLGIANCPPRGGGGRILGSN